MHLFVTVPLMFMKAESLRSWLVFSLVLILRPERLMLPARTSVIGLCLVSG